MKKLISWSLALFFTLTINSSMAIAQSSVVVMSRNIYLGADVGKALELIPDLPAAAQFMWDQMRTTDFETRAELLADEINQSQPDVIGVQEATIRPEPPTNNGLNPYSICRP